MRPSESLAKQILEAIESGSRLIYQEDQSKPVHDFDLFVDGTRTGAVEVTSITDGEARALDAAIERYRFVPRQLCQKDWRIQPASDARIKTIVEKADQYLVAIESSGIERFVSHRDSSSEPTIAAIWQDLRVQSGSVFRWRSSSIGIALPIRGGAYGPSVVLASLGAVLSAEDNLKKLSASGAAHRHLAIYVDRSSTTAQMAIRDHEPPGEPLELPAEITSVWLFAELYDADKYVAWRYEASTGWRRFTLTGSTSNEVLSVDD